MRYDDIINNSKAINILLSSFSEADREINEAVS